jgi:hypothetical protein
MPARFATLYAVLLLTSEIALGATLVVPGTTVTFSSPNGFTSLSQQELDIKFPSKNAPAQAVGNEHRSTTIAYELKTATLSPDALQSTLESMSQTLSRLVPGHAWIDKKLTTIGGREWVYLEFTSNAIDTSIHNIILLTSWQGHMLIFNFNSTASDFEQIEQALRSSIQSIALTEV